MRLTMKVANKSAIAFPGAKVNAAISEHGQSMGTGALEWAISKPLDIPHLEPEKSTNMGPFAIVPLLEGLCEVRVVLEEPPDTEIWITGRRQSARRRTVNAFFSIARWQDMEIISLLRKLEKGGR